MNESVELRSAWQKLTDLRLWAVIFLTVLVKIVAIWVASFHTSTAWFGHTVADIWTWVDFWKGAHQGGIPYVDYTKEYAVGAGLIYWAMSPFIDITEGRWKILLLGHALFVAIADIVNAGLLYTILHEINPRRSFWLTLLFVLLPTGLVLSPVRFEGFVITTVLLGYWCHRHKRPLWATFFWSIGCWVKWFPAFFIAAQEVKALFAERKRWQWLHSGIVFVGVAIAANVPIMVLTLMKNHNLAMWWLPYEFHATRGLSWDTVIGVITLWFGELGWERASTQWTVALMILALTIRPALNVEYKGAMVCIAALLFNRIYSTQFNLWFYPFIAIVLARETGRRFWGLLGLLLGLDLVNITVFPFSFAAALEEMKDFRPLAAKESGGGWTVVFTAAILMRAALLVAIAIFLGRSRPKELEIDSNYGKQLSLFDTT